MRTFYCVPLAEAQQVAIASIADGIRAGTRTRASWVRDGNYHVTVRFLGEIEPMLTLDLDRIAQGVLRRFDPFQIELNRVGAFPSAERARVLWIGGETPAPFADLVRSLEEELRAIGFEPERKPPRAHVTIARIKGRPDRELVEHVEKARLATTLIVPVDRVVLMESQLTPKGAVYTPLLEAALGEPS